jgi:hypothetical protein
MGERGEEKSIKQERASEVMLKDERKQFFFQSTMVALPLRVTMERK